jgi:hypothetical protein
VSLGFWEFGEYVACHRISKKRRQSATIIRLS